MNSVAEYRKDKLVEDKEDEEPQIPKKLRNLDRTPSDAERVGKTAKEVEES